MPLTEAQLTLIIERCKNCRALNRPPVMLRTTNNQLGAYCKSCHAWIKWVPQTELWLTLEQEQRASANQAPPTLVQSDAPGNHDFYTANAHILPDALACIAKECWDIAEANGFHTSPRSPLERAMLVVTELAELSEAARHSKLHDESDHIKGYTYAAEEWADVVIRVFDHCVDDGVSHRMLADAIIAKMEFNRTRGYRHGGKTI